MIINSTKVANKELFTSLSNPRVSQQIIEQIKQVLFSGKLKPGDKLPTERQLAEQFNVSRLLVREALHILESMGLLSIKAGSNGGAFVTIPDYRVTADVYRSLVKLGKVSIQHLVETRNIIEPTAALLAAERASEHDIQLMQESIKSMKNVLKKKEDTIIAYSFPPFHSTVINASKNPVLALTFSAMQDLIYDAYKNITVTPEIMKKNILGHMKIVEAIKQRDQEKAFTAMQKHLVDTQKWIGNSMKTRRCKNGCGL